MRSLCLKLLGRQSRQMVRRALLVLAFVLGCFSIAGGAVAKQQVNHRGVWMAGPGCGARFEWFQHPAWFPYFCDGNAEVEKAHWRNWGSQTATASAILTEAELKSGSSVATAPRTHRPVTIKASQIKVCGGRHAYTRIIIRLHKAVNGIKKLREAELLPKCSSPGAGSRKGRNITDFLSPGRKVWCQFEGYEPQVSCGTEPKPPTHSATLHSSGRVEICSVSQLEIPPGGHIPLGCYQNWPLRGDHLPVLHFGEWTGFAHFRCKSVMAGITCIKVSGAGKGHGFRVNKDEAVEIEP
jgi:hypothetical protein